MGRFAFWSTDKDNGSGIGFGRGQFGGKPTVHHHGFGIILRHYNSTLTTNTKLRYGSPGQIIEFGMKCAGPENLSYRTGANKKPFKYIF
ncbi:MAG: hypothetical protein E4H15_08040 [Syntrophobacterales bacterium]|nr:MAG: hypothetical protein E4H15_08040 [Syntrophobacterales bacterium]